jgi:two-component system sensor histidine kinase ChiS
MDNFIIQSNGLVPFGLYTLIFAQTLVLASRFADAFKEKKQLSEQLVSLNEMKDEFLFNTSHELKTPLHGIMNLSQSMLDEGSGALNEAKGPIYLQSYPLHEDCQI